MLNHMKEREQQNATQSSPDTPLVSNPLAPEEIEALRHDLKTTKSLAEIKFLAEQIHAAVDDAVKAHER